MPRYTSVDQFEKIANPTEAEKKLIAACQAGEPCILEHGTLPFGPSADCTIRASLLTLLITGGSSKCDLHPSGLCLLGAYVTGLLDLRFTKTRGQCFLGACHFDRKPQLEQASFDQLSLEASHLPGLSAQNIHIKGSFFLRKVTSKGTVNVNGAQINGQLDCSEADFIAANSDNKLATALNAQGMRLGESLFLRNLTAKGTVDVVGAQIGGQLDCDGANLDATNPDGTLGKALNAQGVEVGASVFLRNLTANGAIDLAGARIKEHLDCENAHLDATNADGTVGEALNAQRAHVAQGFFFRDLKFVKGQVYLVSAHVGDLVDDLASWPQSPDALVLAGFTYERIIGASTLAQDRLPWLKTGSTFDGTFFPQPYTQLAKVLSDMGHDNEARKVLEVREQRLAYEARLSRRVKPSGTSLLAFENPTADAIFVGTTTFDWLLRRVVGYGYAPMRSLWSLLGLFAIATFFAHMAWTKGAFAPNSDVIITSSDWANLLTIDCIGPLPDGHIDPCVANPADAWSSKDAPGMDWDTFNRYGYAADLVIPILDLGQTDSWAPSKDRGPWGHALWWLRWVLAGAGWIVTGLGAAAVTGIIKRHRG